MGFSCEAALCWADDAKRKNTQKYPWMKELSWVKFPRPSNRQQRTAWRNLLRRKDRFELSRNSRLCSRHFDQADILPNGTAKNPPKYFFWNNFGLIIDKAREERNDRAARRVFHVHVPDVPCPCPEAEAEAPGPDPGGLLLADCCHGIGSEVSVDTSNTRVSKRKREEPVGGKLLHDFSQQRLLILKKQ